MKKQYIKPRTRGIELDKDICNMGASNSVTMGPDDNLSRDNNRVIIDQDDFEDNNDTW